MNDEISMCRVHSGRSGNDAAGRSARNASSSNSRYSVKRRVISILFVVAMWSVLWVSAAHPGEKLYTNTFPPDDIVLLDGPFRHARDLNIRVLLQYDVDRLLAPYRKEAGLPPKAASYPNWDGLDGHIAGHYLSAMAMNYAATRDSECRRRLDHIVAELRSCADAHRRSHAQWGAGYVGGVPNSAAIWSAVKAGDLGPYRAAWVPWYNVHKMYAGLRDAWVYAGNRNARDLFLGFCDWAVALTSALPDSVMQSMLETEHGGMPEVLADAYAITGDAKYLATGEKFSHAVLRDALAAGRDELDNKHANTQIPKVIGFQRIGELMHDDRYTAAGRFFWETVTGHRSLAFGGNSRREFFPAPAAYDDFISDVEGPESCNSYNMLRLTEGLFRVEPLACYADYYERTLLNHTLSTQHPEHGGFVYFTPARPRHYRVYSAPNQAMWCCVGTGMENHGKYGQFIYTHGSSDLYLNLFIASELEWKEKGLRIRQETTFPYEAQTRIRIIAGSGRIRLMVRHPSWVPDGGLRVVVNGDTVSVHSRPSSYVPVDRRWKAGDIVEVHLPMHITSEPLPNVPAYRAFMYGPVLLGARTGTEDLAGLIADDGRWGQIPAGERLPVDGAPILLSSDPALLPEAFVPVPGQSLTFTAPGLRMVNPIPLRLEPFFGIHDTRYMMYWMSVTDAEYGALRDSLAAAEGKRMALDRRTIDRVASGEQQPEMDHAMQTDRSRTGSTLDRLWRDAYDGGSFGYEMVTHDAVGLGLRVTYWGAEWGNRKFSILVDDTLLYEEDNTGRWNHSTFQEIEYAIPDALVRGRARIRVTFRSLPGSTAGAVYGLRLVRAGDTVGGP